MWVVWLSKDKENNKKDDIMRKEKGKDEKS